MISVIIPVFNAEQYVTKTIDSILAQTFTDFELVLVNDGSKDRTGVICEEYANRDARIRVIHQSNAGASEARNHGIVCSKYNLLTFIDADDIVEQDYIEQLIFDFKKHKDADFVIQGLTQIFPDRKILFNLHDEIYDLRNIDDCKRFFDNTYLNDYSGPYCKIYRKEILNKWGITFSRNIIYAEDFDFMLQYLIHCRCVVTSATMGYNYIMHEGSVSNKIYSPNMELRGFKQLTRSFFKLIEKFNYVSVTTMMTDALSSYLWRVLTSLYKHQLKTHERIYIIKSFEPDELYFLKTHYKASSIFTQTVKLLLVNRQARLLDAILKIRIG